MYSIQNDIINYIKTNNGVLLKELANHLNVSDKSIRSYIKAINDEMGNIILQNSNKGYYLKDGYSINLDVQPSIKYTILKNIMRDNSDIYELSANLYMSESNLIKQISFINNDFKTNNLNSSISRKNNRFHCEVSEDDYRQILNYYLRNEITLYNFDISKYNFYFDKVDLLSLKEIIDRYVNKFNYEINEYSFLSLLLHLAILIERSNNYKNNYLDNVQADEGALYLIEEIKANFMIDTSHEYNYIVNLLYKRVSEEDESISVFLDNIIEKIKTNYNVELYSDSDFYNNMLIHLSGLLKRIKTNSFLENPLIDDIRINYPIIYDISVFIALEIEHEFNANIAESEVGYLALHLMNSVNIINNGLINVLLIDPTGRNCNLYLANKLKSINGKIRLINNVSAFDIDKINTMQLDLVISTVYLNTVHKLFKINKLLDNDELSKLKVLINKIQSEKYSYFNEELFYLNQDFKNKEQVLKFMCDDLVKKEYVNEDYLEYVYKREAIAPTAFLKGVAIPHPVEKVANKSILSFMRLNKPITWNNKKVKLVFLISIAKDDVEFDVIYERISLLMSDNEMYDKIVNTNDYKEFNQIFFNYH